MILVIQDLLFFWNNVLYKIVIFVLHVQRKYINIDLPKGSITTRILPLTKGSLADIGLNPHVKLSELISFY